MEKITENISRIDRLRKDRTLPREEMRLLLTTLTKEEEAWLCKNADEVRREHYGTDVYLRGLIEFTNYCRNDCLYCGIRRSNRNARRYRLTTEEILDCSDKGYLLGFRTIVLQGGEDLFFTDEKICSLVSEIKKRHPDCAVTLSIGERPRESYEAFFAAGADRYLLRHETINPVHYSLLHPRELTIENRVRCLKDLREIGFQVGCGMMVGSPYQTVDYLLDDLYFMAEFKPHMIGIGPFIPHKDTPFGDEPEGSVELTLRLLAILPFIPHGDTPFCDRESGTLEDTLHLLAIIRLMNPRVLLPATTALGTIHPLGREMGIQAGANVVMPNLSPTGVRDKYMLYDGKICTGDEAAECRRCMELRMEKIGYHVVQARGDSRV